VANDGRVFQAVVVNEFSHIARHGIIIMAAIMRRVAVVPHILAHHVSARIPLSTVHLNIAQLTSAKT
jgi:hypothetical protein